MPTLLDQLTPFIFVAMFFGVPYLFGKLNDFWEVYITQNRMDDDRWKEEKLNL